MPIIDRARVAAALPGYRLGRELGSGSVGLVLAAQQLPAQQSPASSVEAVGLPAGTAPGDGSGRAGRSLDVAVKILDLGAGAGQSVDPAAEAGVLTGLAHPHLCRVLDVVPVDGLCVLVTDLLPGGTLARQSLTPPAAVAVAVAVADALMHAHAAGVLHLDVKPANVLFTADGRPVLTDVGVAGLLAGTGLAAGQVVGTAQYLAPEQVTGGRLLPATDVYGLAAALYELLAGAPLFGAGLTAPELFLHHCEVVPPPPPGVPPRVAAVLARALAKEPGERHRGPGPFAMELADAAQVDYGRDWLAQAGVPLQISAGLQEQTAAAAPASAAPRVAVAPAMAGAGESQSQDDDPADRTTRLGDPPLPPVTSLLADPVPPAIPTPGHTGPGTPPPSPDPGHPPLLSDLSGRPEPPGREQSSARTRRAAILAAAGVAFAGAVAALTIPLAGGGDAAAPPRPPAGNSGPGPAAPAGPPPPLPAPPPFPVVAVAGTGTAGFAGDGGPAGSAALDGPYGMVADWAGNIYVADFGNNRIRRISADGTIVTVAGTGVEGFAGDGGPATQAQLSHPSALALDSAGNILIADTFNQRIRRVDPAGIITTVAGNGEHAFSGDGGRATDAALWYPGGVVAGRDGTVFIADTANNRIRRVTPDGTITTLAGTDGEGSAGDGGPASEALLAFPISVALDHFGRLYIADSDNNRIRRIGLDGVIETVAGTGRPGYSGDGGPATEATLRSPRGIAIDAHDILYITDRTNRRIRRVDADGVITTVAGTARPGKRDDVDPTAISPDGPVALDPTGDLFVTDRRRNLVLHVHLTGPG
ncbi:serine/threonine protein kinase [Parafrankia colletiae]|uniref:Serine/threonine protein kinase n=1 Tax=Parafrankia colletiae TaxID=573497 RepID=A0A1S1QK91_9ACTN|nr:protein kinase [Parafrankia colletiae]OHV33502.1 serine/threonine protein kinase [Parafrankia colletiae]